MKVFSSVLVGLLLVVAARAGDVITESEPNNSLDNPQYIPPSSFDVGYNPHVQDSNIVPWVTIEGTGDDTWDYYSFDVPQAGYGLSIFDIDDTTGLDSWLNLYDPSGNRITYNDDNWSGDSGSGTGLDSRLYYIFPTTGRYIIGVGRFPNMPVISGATYDLHISLGYDPLSVRQGSGGGDPHFKTWAQEWYDYHGECDLVFLSAPQFANGLGLDIHMRTKMRYQYSHIETAAIRIGEDVFQIGAWGEYTLNGVDGAKMPNKFSGYTISHEVIGDKVHKFKIHVSEMQFIELKTFKDMVTVNMPWMPADMEGSSGLLGSFPEGKLLARDGQTVVEDVNAFGQEWQVLADEHKLFATAREPQHPTQCRLPDLKAKSRRLGESVAEATARKACAGWGDAIEQCVYDVMATGDLEYAVAGAF